jgi:3-oxoacyl-[acyl-carrier protein] reductase
MAGVLQGQVALVTGGGRGIGQGIARAFAAEGASVAVMSRTAEQLAQTVAECEALGAIAIAVAGDVTSRADVERVVAEAERRLGPLTILVNNAGITGPFAPVHAADPDEWWRTQEVHVHGMFLCTRTVLPGMMARGAGRVITIASRAAETGTANFSAYSCAKVAQVRFTELLAAEIASHGMSAFVLHPGTVDTQFADEPLVRADALQWMPGFVERLRMLKEQPDTGNPISQVMDLCVSLASGVADSLSGRYLSVDDDLGRTLRYVDDIRAGSLHTLRIGRLPADQV